MKRWVLVTGGAKRLGREICLAFAKSGWNIACHYSKSFESALELGAGIKLLGVDFVALQSELNSACDAEKLFNLTVQKIATHDIEANVPTELNLLCIVNNASEFQPDDQMSSSGDSFLSQLQTNLVVPVTLTRLLSKFQMQRVGDIDSCVVHILDQKVMNLNPDYSDYTLSKLALERAVSQQAQALAPHIRVNAIAPGLIYPSGPQTQKNFDQASKINAMRRRIDPTQVAKTAVFLAENCCLTGQTIAVDNGQHLVPLARDIMFVTEEILNRGIA
jgi:NAD(P)-dependent dehydrogenase (short-subunit alcohol dehydrogenase family)